MKHKNGLSLNILRFLIPKNFKHKNGLPLSIFQFLITKNFKHKKVCLRSLKYFSIHNMLFHETKCWDSTYLKYLQFKLQFVIFNSQKVPWNWIGSFQSRSHKAVNEGSLISLKFSPFVTVNEISISWKFQPHTYYQSIFVAIWNFWLFCKSCKIWVWASFRRQFLENWILRSFQSQFCLKFTRKCATIS